MGEAKKKSEAKLKDMTENPEKYVKNEDLLFALRYIKEGQMGSLLNNLNRQELSQVIGEVILTVVDRVQLLHALQAQKQEGENHIITPGEKQPANGGIKL